MLKKLSIVFITHNKLIELTNYVNSILNFIPKEIDIIFIYDNKKTNNASLNKRVKFYSWENIGKFKSIIKASKKINSNYLKVIDHDDLIDYRYLNKLLNKIPQGNDYFLHHTTGIVFKESEVYGEITTNHKKLDLIRRNSNDVKWNKIPNAGALYNVDVLREISSLESNLSKQEYFNDDLLCLICQLRKDKIKKIKVNFYYQYHGFGQTKKINKRKMTSQLELFKNIIEYTNNFETNTNNMYSNYEMLKWSIKYNQRIFLENNINDNKNFNESLRLLDSVFNKNKLTLLITIHSDFEAVEFYTNLLELAENQIIFAFDTPSVPERYTKILDEKGIAYFINKNNTGKVKLVLNSLNLIKTDYFKILDQDDSVSIEDLRKANKEIDNLSGPMLIKHKAFKISNNTTIYERTLDKKIIKKQVKESIDVDYTQQTNCDTIYHTRTMDLINKNKVNITRQDFHNDILFSNFCIAIGLPLVRIKNGFYIQFHEMGQTSNLNINRAICVRELYENYKKFSEKIDNFYINRTVGKEQKYHLRFINRFTKKYLNEVNKELGEEIFLDTKKILEELWKKNEV